MPPSSPGGEGGGEGGGAAASSSSGDLASQLHGDVVPCVLEDQERGLVGHALDVDTVDGDDAIAASDAAVSIHHSAF